MLRKGVELGALQLIIMVFRSTSGELFRRINCFTHNNLAVTRSVMFHNIDKKKDEEEACGICQVTCFCHT